MMRKIQSIIAVASIILCSFAISSTVVHSTPNSYSIRGWVYFDLNITQPDDVFITIEGVEYKATLPYELDPVNESLIGYYAKDDISASIGDTLIFDVVLDGYRYENVETYTILDLNLIIRNLNLTIDSGDNQAPNTPYNPNPSDEASNQNRNVDISWSCEDPDGDDLTYTVYFDTVNPPEKVFDDITETTYEPGTLTYSETYYWQIKASDDFGGSTTGPIWQFTVRNAPAGDDDDDDVSPPPGPSGGGGGDDIVGPGENLAPTAVATVDQNTGAPGTEFSFDASGSSDPEGTTLSYTWDFDDESTGTGETVAHTFTEEGTFNVMLTVEDAGGLTDTDTLTIQIVRGNSPPTDLTITPNILSTSVDTDVTFTLLATDADDNDTIRYLIDWDDDTDMTTERYDSGVSVDVTHQWDLFGVYDISVTAEDTENATTMTTATVWVDVYVIDDEINGWLIDTDSDGTFDVFRSSDTETETDVEKQNDTEYLIDVDEDDAWDYIFDTETNTLSAYETMDDDGGFNIALYVLAGLIILLLLVFGYLSYKNKQEQQKKEQEKKQEKKKKQSSKKKSTSSKSKAKKSK